MPKINIDRLINDVYYSFEDFSNNCTKARTTPKYTYINSDRKKLYYDLTNLISGIYNHSMKPRLSLGNNRVLLTKREIYDSILDNINMIESTLLFWMDVQFNKNKRAARVLRVVESIGDFSKHR